MNPTHTDITAAEEICEFMDLCKEYVNDIAAIIARHLEPEREKNENAMFALIDERDHCEESLSQVHIALGGNGEWVKKIPSEEPPNSGDLSQDVPELAAYIKGGYDEALKKLVALRDRVVELERLLAEMKATYIERE